MVMNRRDFLKRSAGAGIGAAAVAACRGHLYSDAPKRNIITVPD